MSTFKLTPVRRPSAALPFQSEQLPRTIPTTFRFDEVTGAIYAQVPGQVDQRVGGVSDQLDLEVRRAIGRRFAGGGG